jgi:hypothetical protein
MEPADSSETPVCTCMYKIIQRLTPEDCNVNSNCRENLRSQKQTINLRFRVLNARCDDHNLLLRITHNVHTFIYESVEVACGMDGVELNEALC